jgi:hypothetical protein
MVPPLLARSAVKVDRANVPVETVRSPVTLMLTPSVVVPPFAVRLLKEVKIVAGSVLVAVSVTVPVPGVQTAVAEDVVIAPATWSVPPDVMSMLLAWLATAPRTRLPAVRVEPLVKVIAPSLLAAVPPTVTAPVTASLGLPVAANVSVAVPAALPILVIDAQTAVVVSTVTVTPALMATTISPATGTACPPQVAVELQLPVTLAVLFAASARRTPAKTKSARTPMRTPALRRAAKLSSRVVGDLKVSCPDVRRLESV